MTAVDGASSGTAAESQLREVDPGGKSGTAAESPRREVDPGGEGVDEGMEEPASGWASLSDDILCSSLAPYFDAQTLLNLPCLSQRLRAFGDAN